jgi:hypothetical protein
MRGYTFLPTFPLMVAAVLTTSTFYSCNTIVPKATIPAVSQISDGQPQAASATAVAQISDGQIQANPTLAVVTQIGDGQIQAAPSVTPIVQISDGQIQASQTPESLTIQVTETPTSTVVVGTISSQPTASVPSTFAPFTGGAASGKTAAMWFVIGGSGAVVLAGMV